MDRKSWVEDIWLLFWRSKSDWSISVNKHYRHAPWERASFRVFAEATGVNDSVADTSEDCLDLAPGLVSNGNDIKRRKYLPQNHNGPLDTVYTLQTAHSLVPVTQLFGLCSLSEHQGQNCIHLNTTHWTNERCCRWWPWHMEYSWPLSQHLFDPSSFLTEPCFCTLIWLLTSWPSSSAKGPNPTSKMALLTKSLAHVIF